MDSVDNVCAELEAWERVATERINSRRSINEGTAAREYVALSARARVLAKALESIALGAKLAADIIPAETGYQGWVIPLEETARAALAEFLKLGGDA